VVWDGGVVTAERLRERRRVKPVAGPSGVTIGTRMRTCPEDERVLYLVAAHLGRLRRADLARVCRPARMDFRIDREAKRAVQRNQLNSRKRALTGESSARWANAIIAGNEDQCQLARDAQFRHIVGLRAAITTLEKRLAQPTGDMLCVEQRRQRRKAKRPKGYPTQAERLRSNAVCRRCGPSWPASSGISRAGGCE
jgi:hypothetical protein